MKLLTKITSFVVAPIVFLANSTSVFAATATSDTAILCDDGVSVNTAFGCVPVELDKFIAWLLPYVFGIGGIIAFILMIVGFIQMTTSQGDPKAIEGGKETITSAVVGLLICILAIFILRLITVNILHIPGIS